MNGVYPACQSCPTGGSCTQWNTSWPATLPGYWRSDRESIGFFACNPPVRASSAIALISACLLCAGLVSRRCEWHDRCVRCRLSGHLVRRLPAAAVLSARRLLQKMPRVRARQLLLLIADLRDVCCVSSGGSWLMYILVLVLIFFCLIVLRFARPHMSKARLRTAHAFGSSFTMNRSLAWRSASRSRSSWRCSPRSRSTGHRRCAVLHSLHSKLFVLFRRRRCMTR